LLMTGLMQEIPRPSSKPRPRALGSLSGTRTETPPTSSVRSLPRSAKEFPPIPALGYHVNFSANWISLGSVDVEVSKPATPFNKVPLESNMSVLSGVTGTAKFA
jgi:hypothetical protein